MSGPWQSILWATEAQGDTWTPRTEGVTCQPCRQLGSEEGALGTRPRGLREGDGTAAHHHPVSPVWEALGTGGTRSRPKLLRASQGYSFTCTLGLHVFFHGGNSTDDAAAPLPLYPPRSRKGDVGREAKCSAQAPGSWLQGAHPQPPPAVPPPTPQPHGEAPLGPTLPTPSRVCLTPSPPPQPSSVKSGGSPVQEELQSLGAGAALGDQAASQRELPSAEPSRLPAI